MEEKKPSLWDKTKNWIMGITTLVVAGGGTAYVVNEISQDEHKDKTEKTVDPKTGRLTGFDIVQEKGRFTAYDEQGKEIGKLDSHQIVNKDDAKDNSDWVYEPTPGTKEAFMAEETKKFTDNIKIERFGNKSEKGESTGYYVRKNTDGEHIIYNADGDRVGKLWRPTGLPIIPVIKRKKTEQEQAKEFTDRIRRDISIAQGEISEFSPADNNDFGDLADAVRAKSENLQQKKNGTDTPAPQPNAAEDHNREAVLPKQTKLASTRGKGGRKGGESLGA